MRPHPRIRKTVKWGGVALLVIFAAVHTSAFFYNTTLITSWGGACGCWYGRVFVAYDTSMYGGFVPPGFKHERFWIDEGNRHALHLFASPAVALVPWWLTALFLATPTMLAWFLDARARRHDESDACRQCSYSRTGLAPSALCPECGAAAPIGSSLT